MDKKNRRDGMTQKSEKEVEKLKLKITYPNNKVDLALEKEGIQKEMESIKNKLFPNTWENNLERWQSAFQEVYIDLKELYLHDPKVQNSAFVRERFKQEVWNYEVLSYMLNQAVSVGTLKNWNSGKTSPRLNKRDVVIQLGFLAKYDEEKMNKLLRYANLPILYVKGTRANRGMKININDYVYRRMIEQRYPFGTESFTVAERCSAKATDIIQKAVEEAIKDEKKELVPPENSTSSIIEDGKKLRKKESFSIGEEEWISDVITYVKEHISSFAYSYIKFMGDLADDFQKNYKLSISGKQYQCYDEEIELYYDEEEISSINKLTGEWEGYLGEILSTAFNTKKHKVRMKMYVPNREDIIVLALLLAGDDKKINTYLADCSFEKLYPADKVEVIISYGRQKGRELQPESVIELVCKHYPEYEDKIKKSYKKNKEALSGNIMLKSLQVFEWIKFAWEYAGVSEYEEAKNLCNQYPEGWLIKSLCEEILSY